MYYHFLNNNLREWHSSKINVTILIIYDNNELENITFENIYFVDIF